jgi:hypothetical protein
MESFKISSPKSTTYVLRCPFGSIKIIKLEGGEGYHFQLKAPVGKVRVNYSTEAGLSRGLKGLRALMAECGSISDAIIILNEVSKNDKT